MPQRTSEIGRQMSAIHFLDQFGVSCARVERVSLDERLNAARRVRHKIYKNALTIQAVHFLLVTLLLASPGWGAEPSESTPHQPNIVIFLVDDMGLMDTSVPFLADTQGRPDAQPLNAYYRTPNMARLAAQGTRFSNFYAMSVCSPSRVSLLTGQNSARHRVTNWIHPEKNNSGPLGPADWNWQGLGKDSVTLPRLLKQQNYHTILVGKAHFAPKNAAGADPRSLGFDVSIAGSSIGHPGTYYGKTNYGAGTNNPVPDLEKYHGTETFLTEALSLETKSQLSQAVQGKQPFFLYFAQYAVHSPFQSDPRFAEHYRDSGKPRPAQAFATLIEGMDQALGELLDHLDALGVAEETLVIFLGDNGTDAPLGGAHEVACAAPLRGKKGSHYEGGMRVPCIAAWAAPNSDNPVQQKLPIEKAKIQTQLGAIYDVFPTLLQLADVPVPAGHDVDGAALQPLLAGQHVADRGELFLMHYPHAKHRTDYFTCLRHGDWKVIYHYFPTKVSDGSHYQLFNLTDDPSESHDLSKTQPEKLRQMMQELVKKLEDQHAQYPFEQPERITVVKPIIP